MKNGLKLKKLSKTIKYETGELIYGKKKNDFSLITTYKIFSITEKVDKIVRDYCKNTIEFDIDNLNKLITKALL